MMAEQRRSDTTAPDKIRYVGTHCVSGSGMSRTPLALAVAVSAAAHAYEHVVAHDRCNRCYINTFPTINKILKRFCQRNQFLSQNTNIGR